MKIIKNRSIFEFPVYEVQSIGNYVHFN